MFKAHVQGALCEGRIFQHVPETASFSLSVAQSMSTSDTTRQRPFNGTNVRGKHKKSAESYGMGNKSRETRYKSGMSMQGSSLPFISGETAAGLGQIFRPPWG